MHLTRNKLNSQKVAALREEISKRSSAIEKYTKNPRVEKKLVDASFKIIVSAPKKQEDVPSRVDERPELMNAADTARMLSNLAKSEHDIETLESYKDKLMKLHKAIKAAAPKSEFNKHKPL